MGRFETSLAIMGSSWELLKKDKEILIIPVVSGIAMMMLAASFFIPVFFAHDPTWTQRAMQEDRDSFLIMSFVYFPELLIHFFLTLLLSHAQRSG